ncbi:hypothetical protein GOP47_0028042 [Adiantum capillus-veneris]|nr:hypothetical protein GOP47_0028042 [Adiantum capillus-veneris]
MGMHHARELSSKRTWLPALAVYASAWRKGCCRLGEIVSLGKRCSTRCPKGVPDGGDISCQRVRAANLHKDTQISGSIKLCVVVATLYKLQHLRKSLGLDVSLTTPLAFYPLQEGEPLVDNDPSEKLDGMINLSHEIRKTLLVSDNVAFNRLYAFTGQRYTNEKMWQLGLLTTRVRHRLSVPLSREENRFCEPVELHVSGCPVTLAPKKNADLIQSSSDCEVFKLGVGQALENGEVVMEPMDFSQKNYISLLDLQNLMVKIFFPNVEQSGEPCKLPCDYQTFLQEALADYPSASCYPLYPETDFPDDYCKLFLPGICRVRPKNAVRIFNKIGRAYGFTIENSYIFDKERAHGFFLSAVVYTNSNGIMNDDKYEYVSIADHLMADLGDMVARAVWKIPPPAGGKVPVSLDCIPSSSWKKKELADSNEGDDGEVEGLVDFIDGSMYANIKIQSQAGTDGFQSIAMLSSTGGLVDHGKGTTLLGAESTTKIAHCYKYFVNE